MDLMSSSCVFYTSLCDRPLSASRDVIDSDDDGETVTPDSYGAKRQESIVLNLLWKCAPLTGFFNKRSGAWLMTLISQMSHITDDNLVACRGARATDESDRVACDKIRGMHAERGNLSIYIASLCLAAMTTSL